MQNSGLNLQSKRALVVGGAGAIGLAISEGLLESGARVVIADNRRDLNERVNLLNQRGYKCEGLNTDITKQSDIVKSVDSSKSHLEGDIDILVNAAGIQRRSPSETFPEHDWDEVISVNLKSVFLYSQIVAIDMLKNKSGKIINIASIMSVFGGKNIPAYAASKGGVAQLTKSMSNDWASKGICVNAIAPGYIETPLNEKLLADSVRSAEILSRTPVGRWGKPCDLKGIALLLASNASDFITGAVIPVDGGYSAW
jgi:2-deoxy-D-gluconate 3-dehydrogenase